MWSRRGRSSGGHICLIWYMRELKIKIWSRLIIRFKETMIDGELSCQCIESVPQSGALALIKSSALRTAAVAEAGRTNAGLLAQFWNGFMRGKKYLLTIRVGDERKVVSWTPKRHGIIPNSRKVSDRIRSSTACDTE